MYPLDSPLHVATATAHFAIMALTGAAVQVPSGDFAHGAHLFRRVHSKWILHSLAVGLIPFRASR